LYRVFQHTDFESTERFSDNHQRRGLSLNNDKSHGEFPYQATGSLKVIFEEEGVNEAMMINVTTPRHCIEGEMLF